MFEKGGEPERAAAEKAELDVIAQWLPALASEDTVRGWIQSLIDDGNTNPGKLMGLLMKDHKDELDGKLAREPWQHVGGNVFSDSPLFPVESRTPARRARCAPMLRQRPSRPIPRGGVFRDVFHLLTDSRSLQ